MKDTTAKDTVLSDIQRWALAVCMKGPIECYELWPAATALHAKKLAVLKDKKLHITDDGIAWLSRQTKPGLIFEHDGVAWTSERPEKHNVWLCRSNGSHELARFDGLYIVVSSFDLESKGVVSS